MRLRARSVHERIRPRHHLTVDLERQLGELAGLERRPVSHKLQRIKPLCPALVARDGGFKPFRCYGHGAYWTRKGSV